MQNRSETWTEAPSAEEMVSTLRFKCQFTKIGNNQTVKSSNQNEDWAKRERGYSFSWSLNTVYLQELFKWKSVLKIAIQIQILVLSQCQPLDIYAESFKLFQSSILRAIGGLRYSCAGL